jgi:hypothetical protein
MIPIILFYLIYELIQMTHEFEALLSFAFGCTLID